ncbi:hypothetical protein CCYN49044_210074 [Capnocytophaga cynodegmi]|nr:hypothetical protein CCYN49044_210074 [Capnocytophaga cynodegmi]
MFFILPGIVTEAKLLFEKAFSAKFITLLGIKTSLIPENTKALLLMVVTLSEMITEFIFE